MTRIKWTARERNEIFAEMLSSGYRPGDHGFGPAVNKAQKALPADRQRNLALGLGASGKMLANDFRIYCEGLERKKIQEPEAPSIEALLRKLISEIVIQELEARYQQPQIITHITAKEQDQHTETFVRGKKILVIGLKGDQETIIKNAFADKTCQLRFWDKEKTVHGLANLAMTMDVVVLWTNFVSHAHQNAIRKHPGLVLVTGGVDTMLEAIKRSC